MLTQDDKIKHPPIIDKPLLKPNKKPQTNNKKPWQLTPPNQATMLINLIKIHLLTWQLA